VTKEEIHNILDYVIAEDRVGYTREIKETEIDHRNVCSTYTALGAITR
jgi:hypothetical protein